jgi:hypothetical protein
MNRCRLVRSDLIDLPPGRRDTQHKAKDDGDTHKDDDGQRDAQHGNCIDPDKLFRHPDRPIARNHLREPTEKDQ